MGKFADTEARKAQILAEKAEKMEEAAIDAADSAIEQAKAAESKKVEPKSEAKPKKTEPKSEAKPKKAEPKKVEPKAKEAEEVMPDEPVADERAEEKGFDQMSSDELNELLSRAQEQKARAEAKMAAEKAELEKATGLMAEIEELAKRKAEEEARAKAKAEEEAKRLAESKRKADLRAASGAVVAGGEKAKKPDDDVSFMEADSVHMPGASEDYDVYDSATKMWVSNSTMHPVKGYKWWSYKDRDWFVTRNIHVARASSDIWDTAFFWEEDGKLVRLLNAKEIDRYVPSLYW